MEAGKDAETEKSTKAGFETAEKNVEGFDFNNALAGLEGRSYTPGTFNAFNSQAAVGQLGPAAQGQGARLGASQGYDSQGYDSQGYTAQGTNVAGLARGAAYRSYKHNE